MAEQSYSITTLTSVPASSAVSGVTIETIGTAVQVTGGDAREVLKIGDWIVDLTGKECRQVKFSRFDNRSELVAPFSTDITAGTNLIKIPKDLAKVIYMRLNNIGGADTTIGDFTFIADDNQEYGQPNPSGITAKFVSPKVVDGATSEVNVNIEWYANTIPQLN